MAAKHPFPLPRTISKMQLASHDNLPRTTSTEASAGKRKPFLHQVIGFNPSSKDTDVAVSPRSVLSGVGSGFLQIRSPRSPRSGLESVLSGSRPWEQDSSEGVGLRIISSLNATEEDTAKASKALMLSISQRKCVPKQSEPINISHSQPRSCPGKQISFAKRDFANENSMTTFAGSYEGFQPGIKHPEESLAYAEGKRHDSIFSTEPTFSCNVSGSLLPEMDFLNSCFFCKRKLGPGKDIFMYRGDRAFCSAECRYQHIVFDERKERCSASSSSVPSRSSSKHRSRIHSSTPAAAA